MSEDCHDSNNERSPERIERDADMMIMLPCTECGELLAPFEAYPVEIEHFDGRPSEIALFHADWRKMCPLKYANKRLEAANAKLMQILEIAESLLHPPA
jgi:hypothetical protein